MTTERTHVVARIGAMPVDHFTGARRTRRTFAAFCELTTGERVACGHEQHRTVDAAIACGRKLEARLDREATSRTQAQAMFDEVYYRAEQA